MVITLKGIPKYFIILITVGVISTEITTGEFVGEWRYDGQHYAISNLSLSYDEASQHCESFSYKLLEIQTAQVQSDVDEFLDEMNQNARIESDFIWIGLKLKPTLNRGRWNKKTFFIQTSYSNWFSNQPSKSAGECVSIRAHPSFATTKRWEGWFNRNCSQTCQFVCQGDVGGKEVEIVEPPICIDRLLHSLSYFNYSDALDSEDLKSFYGLVNNVLVKSEEHDLDEINSAEAKTIILLAERLAKKSHPIEDTIGLSLPNIYIDVQNISASDVSDDLVIGKPMNTKASYLTIPSTLLQELTAKTPNNSLQLSAIIYHKSSLFETAQNKTVTNSDSPHGKVATYPAMIIGDILSINVPAADTSHLNNSFSFYIPTDKTVETNTDQSLCDLDTKYSRLPKFVKANVGVYWNKSSKLRYVVEKKCAFLDTQIFQWSTEGCHMEKNGENKTICSCNHMTHFSIIFEISEMFTPEYLSHISFIGCTISIVCLTLTIWITLSFRQLRSKVLHQIILHISLSLLILNVVFIVGIDRTSDPSMCLVSTMTLHYSVLLAWSWMLVEGLFLFKSIVMSKLKAMSGFTTSVIASTTTMCYILPAALVATSYFLMDEYQSDKYCWLQYQPLMFTVVLPIGVVLAINLFILVQVMYYITCKSKMFSNRSDFQIFSLAARRAVCMLFVLGIPWILGYFMLVSTNREVKHYFSVAFSIVNSLQGFAIFFFYCYRQENVKKLCLERMSNVRSFFP